MQQPPLLRAAHHVGAARTQLNCLVMAAVRAARMVAERAALARTVVAEWRWRGWRRRGDGGVDGGVGGGSKARARASAVRAAAVRAVVRVRADRLMCADVRRRQKSPIPVNWMNY